MRYLLLNYFLFLLKTNLNICVCKGNLFNLLGVKVNDAPRMGNGKQCTVLYSEYKHRARLNVHYWNIILQDHFHSYARCGWDNGILCDLFDVLYTLRNIFLSATLKRATSASESSTLDSALVESAFFSVIFLFG